MKSLQRSFAGGEITPELAGRVDLTKYQTGLSLARNFITLPHGPATRRPGFEFINEAGNSELSVRLFPFVFSTSQSAVLELGHLYLRVHVGGETVVEDAVAITSIASNLVVTDTAHGYATGDRVFIGGRWFNIVVTATDQFSTYDLWGAAATPVGSEVQREFRLVTDYQHFDLADLTITQDSDVVTLTHVGYPTRELRRLAATNWTLTDIDFSPSSDVPGTPNVVATVATAGNPVTHEYCVTAVSIDGVSESLASGVGSASNDLTLAGNYNTLDWTPVTSSSRYYVYKKKGGVFGFIGQTSTSNTLVDNNVDPDTTQSPPEDIIGLNAGPLDYPAAATHHEQRRWFAGPTRKPQTVFATRTGTLSDLTSSLPVRDTDGMEFRLAATQNNQIQHLVPLSDLLALTAGGVFRIFADGQAAITPTSISTKAQGNAGASRVQPVTTANSVLYVHARGSRVRELSYSWEANSFRSTDISIMAPHRFYGRTITQLAFQSAPDPTLWAVRDDGVLLGLTYVPEQQVGGWHAHDTYGSVESVCVVPEGAEDRLYLVVRRLVKGRAVRYIERMRSRQFEELADAFYVDAGLTYDAGAGNTVTQVSGLWHLDTATVQVLADGAVHPPRTINNGTLTLDYPARKVQIGVQMVSDLRTLPLALEAAAGGQGTVKNVSIVHLRVHESSVFHAGPAFDDLTEYQARLVATPMDSPPALVSGEVSVSVPPAWNQDAAVCVRVDTPLPLTIAAMTLEGEIGD